MTSKIWRVAVVVEGPTDRIVIEAIIDSLLADTDADFELQTLQPEVSAAFGSGEFGPNGAGWGGVYQWCRQAADEGRGSVSGSLVLSQYDLPQYDLLIIHVDADVADARYASAGIQSPQHDDLPCDQPCPPPHRTTDALRKVVLRWLGESTCPPRVVLCTPSKSMDAWVLTALFPDCGTFQQQDWECHPKPDKKISTLPLWIRKRFEKRKEYFQGKQLQIREAWPRVSEKLTEAQRFREKLTEELGAGMD